MQQKDKKREKDCQLKCIRFVLSKDKLSKLLSVN